MASALGIKLGILGLFASGCNKDSEQPTNPEAGGAIANRESTPTNIVVREPQPPPRPPPKKRWQPFTHTDKMDDSQVIAVKLLADEDVRTMYGRSYRPRFTIGCQKNTTRAYFDVGTPLSTETRAWESDSAYGYRSGTPLRLRIDKDPPFSNLGDTSTDGESAFVSNPTTALKKMIGRQTLLVEYTPMGSAPQTVTFTIDGIGDAIADVRKACRW